MRIAEALREATKRISASSDTARLDAELLMAQALGVARSDLLLRHMDAEEPKQFQEFVERRAAHEPVAYITGWTEFYGRRFDVGPGVLIARPDSEAVIEAALEACPVPHRVLDMGTGSGALLLTILAECEGARGSGVDASEKALQTAQNNAETHGLQERCAFHHLSWRDAGWDDGLGPFDLIVCNPPYVETDAKLAPDVRDFEPSEALFSGPEGLDDYRIIIPQLGHLLKSDGAAILEVGHRQAEMVTQIAKNHGFGAKLRRDLANRPRCLTLRKGK